MAVKCNNYTLYEKITKINNKQVTNKLIHLSMKGIEYKTKIKFFQLQIKTIKIFK